MNSNGNVCASCGKSAVLEVNGVWLCLSCIQVVLDLYHEGATWDPDTMPTIQGEAVE